MEITLREAAEALSVCDRTVSYWYCRKHLHRPNAVIDTEVLCDILGMDHRFMIAFLAGYDTALTVSEVTHITKYSRGTVESKMTPVFRLSKRF